MRVYSPADAEQTKAVIRHLMDNIGPAYVRLPRLENGVIYSGNYGVYTPAVDVLRAGDDVTIAATGVMVEYAMQAAEELAYDKITCRVLNVHCLKPLENTNIVTASRETCGIVTVEDHSVIGGLGSAISEILSERNPIPLIRVGIQDRFGQSGTVEQLMEEYGLTVKGIKEAVMKIMRSKSGRERWEYRA
jgi:transketolase